MNHASARKVEPRRSALPRGGMLCWPLVVSLLALAVSCTPEADKPEPPATAARPEPPTVSAAADQTAAPPASPWSGLENDGLHDPGNPALSYLQQPGEALSELPPAKDGNQVDWVAALRNGIIAPRTNIYPETKIKVLDLDILMEQTAGMPRVLFPHRAHTEWLDCENCHDKIFKAKQGANPINMFKILQGEFCGQCHGAVAFPLTQCYRCHSVPRPGTPAASGG